jgi:tetratricopeptide (TPR) repeat protein
MNIKSEFRFCVLVSVALLVGCAPPPEVKEEELETKSMEMSEAKKYYSFGCEYLKNKMYDEAIKSLERAIEDSSTFVSAYINLGLAYRGKHEHEEMERVYKRMKDIDPAKGHYALGKLYTDEKNYEEAKREYEETIKIDSGYVDAWYGVGYVEEKVGNTESAIKYYKLALGIDAENKSVRYSLSKAYIANGQHEKAIEELRILRDAHPEDVDVRRIRGEALLAMKKYVEAKSEFGYVVERLPRDVTSRMELARACEGLKDYPGADSAYREAIAIDTTDISAYCHSLSYYVRVKRLSEANELLKTARRVDPENQILYCLAGDVWSEFGNAAFQGKNYGAAMSHYEKAIREYRHALKGGIQEWITYAQKAIKRTEAKFKKAKEEKFWNQG